MLCGVDEAGRGPLAGPVVAAAVVLPSELTLPGINDSKKLSVKQREALYRPITEQALGWAVGLCSAAEIDAMNILEATMLAMRRAIGQLAVRPDFLLIDGNRMPCQAPGQAIVGGDGKVACIAAASVIAKVTRDRMMIKLDTDYPGYGLAQHKGYPTKDHYEALRRLGPSDLHRRSFLRNVVTG